MFTEIFKSFDLKGNKIKNVRTDSPIHDEDVTNKKFVDQRTIYITDKVNRFITPFKLNWVTAPANKSVLDLFDDIFFPRIEPEYLNPTMNVTLHTVNDLSDYVFKEMPLTLKFDIKTIPNDRMSDGLPYIYVEYVDGDTFTHELTSSSYVQTVDVTLPINKEFVKIEIRWDFTPSEPKLDSYGDESIPFEFIENYQLQYDLMAKISLTKTFYKHSVWYKPFDSETEYNDFVEQTYTTNEIVMRNFIKTSKSLTLPVDKYYIMVLIPKELYNIANIENDFVKVTAMITNYKTIFVDEIEYCLFPINIGSFSTEKTFTYKLTRKFNGFK